MDCRPIRGRPARSAFRTFHVDHRPAANQDVRDEHLSLLAHIHVAVNEAGGDAEVIARIQLDRFLPLRPEFQPHVPRDQEPVEAPLSVVVPGRDDAAPDRRPRDQDAVAFERLLPENPRRGPTLRKSRLSDYLYPWRARRGAANLVMRIPRRYCIRELEL
jgi:hypothetical protein